jgi:hypothetical protein
MWVIENVILVRPNMTNMVIIQYTIFMTLIIEFNLGIKLNTEMVKILNKLSFTGFFIRNTGR